MTVTPIPLTPNCGPAPEAPVTEAAPGFADALAAARRDEPAANTERPGDDTTDEPGDDAAGTVVDPALIGAVPATATPDATTAADGDLLTVIVTDAATDGPTTTAVGTPTDIPDTTAGTTGTGTTGTGTTDTGTTATDIGIDTGTTATDTGATPAPADDRGGAPPIGAPAVAGEPARPAGTRTGAGEATAALAPPTGPAAAGAGPAAYAVDGPAEAQAPAPAPAPPPAEQMVAVLRPLGRSADGSHRLRLELRPPELGRVEMRVEMRDGVLHTVIVAETAHAANVLRDALGDLRSMLQSEGVTIGDLLVADGRADGHEPDDDAPVERTDRAATEPEPPVAGVSVPAAPTGTDRLLDVRI